jgi:hypothetical protein
VFVVTFLSMLSSSCVSCSCYSPNREFQNILWNILNSFDNPWLVKHWASTAVDFLNVMWISWLVLRTRLNVSVNPKSLLLSGIECWCVILKPFTSLTAVFCSLLEFSAAWYCSAVKRCYNRSYFVFSGYRWLRCWPLWFIFQQETREIVFNKNYC